MTDILESDLVVIGGGPGGYAAAFRAADLGLRVILIEQDKNLGGVCLNTGCIPSKALLHAAEIIENSQSLNNYGIKFNAPEIDVNKLKNWKDNIINQLASGIKTLAKKRNVTVINGRGEFADLNLLNIFENNKNNIINKIKFKYSIIATGSRSIKLNHFPEDSRIWDSSSALELEKTKNNKLLIIGGGIIGLEMATIYHALGAEIHIVELSDQLIPTADLELVNPLYKIIAKKYNSIRLKTKVTQIEAKSDYLWVTVEENGEIKPAEQFDRVLVAIGRMANTENLGLDKLGVKVDNRNFILVDNQLRTNISHIFAIGDVIGQPMLAHKAHAEAIIAAEVIAGKKHYFDPRVIPSVAYTDPEIAWVGLTEREAKLKNINYEKAVFPWAASGRALSLTRSEGLTILLFDPQTQRLLGGGIAGKHAGELITELALAIEMGCEAEDIALTIHPHPTLSETVAFAADLFLGKAIDLYLPKKI